MNEDISGSYDNIDFDIDEFIREEEQYRKRIESLLWKAVYTGYTIMPYGGLIFITNKAKTKKEQLKWLKKYSELLRTYGIEATVYDEKPEPYICI